MSDPRIAGFGLDPLFADKLVKLLDACHGEGLTFKVAQGLRTPQTQALYYCQWDQRSPADIGAQADKLEADGAPWTADLMRSYAKTKRQKAWQTSQLPGSGWHQWGEAADCYCYKDGVMVGNGDDPCYKTYADLAQKIGLTAGYYFSHPDPGHVQLRPEAGATSLYNWTYIDQTMMARFSAKPALAVA